MPGQGQGQGPPITPPGQGGIPPGQAKKLLGQARKLPCLTCVKRGTIVGGCTNC